MSTTTIRRDIYSVKQFDGHWTHCRMFYSRTSAERYLAGEKAVNPFARLRIVHPAHWVVDAFLAAGNDVWN